MRLLHRDSAALQRTTSLRPCRGGFFIHHNQSRPDVSPTTYSTCHDKVTLGGSVHHGPSELGLHIIDVLLLLTGAMTFWLAYFAVHIRRGDFQVRWSAYLLSLWLCNGRACLQYTHTRLDSQQLWSNIQHLLNASIAPILYIATDEKVRN